MSSNEPHGTLWSSFERFQWRLISIVRATSETIEAPTGSRAPSSRKVKRPGGDRKEAAATAVKRQTQYKTICGIDFGTTHSDVAIVGSVHCGISHIEVLRNWKNGLYLEQVPSRIAYPEENPGLDKITFGYEVTSTMKSYTWMKLLLGKVEMDDFTETKLGTKAAQGMLELPPGKTAEDVSHEDKCWRRRPIEFWLTTPACWDDETDTLTRKCALAAGFASPPDDNLCMMREPDTALVANVSSSINKHEGIYKPGMSVGVVDIGGGTIDTKTMTLISLNPLRAKDACLGTGAKIGMTDLEFRLYDRCEALFGNAFCDLPTEVIGPSSEFAEEFEVVKRSFDGGDDDKKHWLRLLPLKRALEATNTTSEKYDFVEGKLILTGREIRAIFEPVIQEGLKQLHNQISRLKKAGRKPVSMVVLAGGGGTSRYVIHRFQEYCATALGGTVTVRRDGRAWSAVVRGAAVKGLEGGVIVSQEAPRAYGFVCHKQVDGSIDNEEDSFQCPIYGKRASNRMDSILHQGATIVADMKVTKDVYISPKDMEDLSQYWDFFECEEEVAPERLDDDGLLKQLALHITTNFVAAVKKSGESGLT
ncbi:hypothetical protein GJ744_011095 [Endocarpon pusillum]|uniref:Actin-like ATPase domain-containing protein n=1 Tax=Endocarpon pusillum TaxID=364733 RepID=A0A8H7E1D0_9EURO|nr:hypothetical protein GJ744_011095 [Endocarpon pusillum]